MSRWKKIFQSPNFAEAHLIKEKLEAAGIGAVLVNKQDSSYNMFGQVEVHVPQGEVIPALNLLKDNERKED